MGNRYYFSGGTTGKPRLVQHDQLDWELLTIDTALVLRQLGVDSRTLVLLAQPSFPWGIGETFSNAISLCGGSVLALGHRLSSIELVEALKGCEPPNTIVAPVGLLLEWANESALSLADCRILIVGEPISEKAANLLKAKFKAKSVRRIYGESSLGTVAYQISEGVPDLATNPRFTYELSPLGELRITCLISQRRIETGDIFETRDPVGQSGDLWFGSTTIRFNSRSHLQCVLKDGTRICEQAILKTAKDLSISQIQVSYEKPDLNNEILIFRYCHQSEIPKRTVIEAIRKNIPELSDGYLEGAYPNFVIQIFRRNAESLQRTDRGKILTIVTNINDANE